LVPHKIEKTGYLRKYNQKRPECQADRRRPPTAVQVGLGLAIASLGFACATLAYAYVATHPPRRRFTRTPAEIALEFEEVSFLSRDGLKLSGWFLPAPFPQETQGVIAFCHGYPQNRLEMLPYAHFLHEAGFAALVFDFRALGRSEGNLCSFGHEEVADLQGALDYLDSRPDTEALPKGVLGLSLGAAVAIMASAQDTRVLAVVAEAPYPSLRDALDKRCSVVFGPLGSSVARPILWWAKRWISRDPAAVSPAAVLHALAPRPLLLIQGQRDLLVDWRDAVRMAEVAPEFTELWLMPQAGHAQCFRKGGEEYKRRVTQFFQENLNRG
jgi:fermentation-respiration switch protein FrsA (DUF1100 family)